MSSPLIRLAACCLASHLLTAGDAIVVRVDAKQPLHQVSDRFAGSNFCALWNDTGATPGAVAATAKLGLGTIRFPGGVPCQWWDWQEPLASGWTTITTGTAWDLAKAGGSQLALQTNTANTSKGTDKETGKQYSFDSSPEHQAAWVRWCREQGMQVAWWEIGNEPEMDAPKDIKGDDARVFTWYNEVYGKQVAALRAVDPKLRVAGPASTNEWFWWRQNNIGKFLAAHGDRTGTGLADIISLHWYPEGGKGGWEEKRSTAQRWQQAWDFIRAVIAKHDTRQLPVLVSEWNWGGGQDNDSAAAYATALGNADIVGMFRRTGVWAHQHFCLQHIQRGWGMLATKKDSRPESRPSPTFFSLLLAGRLGRHVLPVMNPADEGNVLAAYAGKDDAGGVQVLLISKSGEAQSVRLEIGGDVAATGSLLLMEPGTGGLQAGSVKLGGVDDPDPTVADMPAGAPLRADAVIALPPYGLALATFAGAAEAKPAKPVKPSKAKPAPR